MTTIHNKQHVELRIIYFILYTRQIKAIIYPESSLYFAEKQVVISQIKNWNNYANNFSDQPTVIGRQHELHIRDSKSDYYLLTAQLL